MYMENNVLSIHIIEYLLSNVKKLIVQVVINNNHRLTLAFGG